MNIYYREPTLLEQMNDAIANAGERRIDYFELSQNELDTNWTKFDRTTNNRGETVYSHKGITIKVIE